MGVPTLHLSGSPHWVQKHNTCHNRRFWLSEPWVRIFQQSPSGVCDIRSRCALGCCWFLEQHVWETAGPVSLTAWCPWWLAAQGHVTEGCDSSCSKGASLGSGRVSHRQEAALSPALPVLRECSLLVSAQPPEIHSLLRTGALPHNLARSGCYVWPCVQQLTSVLTASSPVSVLIFHWHCCVIACSLGN